MIASMIESIVNASSLAACNLAVIAANEDGYTPHEIGVSIRKWKQRTTVERAKNV